MAEDDDDLDDVDIPEATTSPDAAYAPGEAPRAARWPANRGGRLDVRTWPHVAQVFMNRLAAEELIRDLQQVLDVTSPTGAVLIEYRVGASGTTLQISNDEGTTGKPS